MSNAIILQTDTEVTVTREAWDEWRKKCDDYATWLKVNLGGHGDIALAQFGETEAALGQ